MLPLVRYLDKFKNQKILVIGDIMLDKFLWGSVSRISPEAPVQVVNVKRESYAPGGAANVAANIASLSKNTSLMGVMGQDETKNIMKKILEKKKVLTKGILIDKNKPTVKKVRILAQNQQLLRVDYEKPEYLNKKDETKMKSIFQKYVKEITAIVVSDYAKGVVTKEFMHNIITTAKSKNIPVIIDPKPKHVSYYEGATLITPNHKEACKMAGVDVNNSTSILDVGRTLLEKTKSNILITRGEKGMSLFKQDKQIIHIPTQAKEVFDVTGAGDTVIAMLALALGSGAILEEAAEIANHAAGIVVGKIGTATVAKEELARSLAHA